MTRSTLCLVMQVYNNEDTILACLESLEGLIDYWIIVDNQHGSTDDTYEIVKEYMGGTGVPGEYLFYNQPFHSGNKRTWALQAAFEKAEYLLVMDADNTLEILPAIDLPTEYQDGSPGPAMRQLIHYPQPFADLTEDAYMITKKCGEIEYPVVSLLHGFEAWKYTGIIHEYPERVSGQAFTQPLLPGVIIHEPVKWIGEGAGQRSRLHYLNHAILLERELLDNRDLPGNLRNRYYFYLAQSYRDAGMTDRALEMYQVRINMGGWEEEIFYSYLSIARLIDKATWFEKLSEDRRAVALERSAYDAWFYRQQRLEAALLVMQRYMAMGHFDVALNVGRLAKMAQPCNDLLFIEHETYTKLFPDLLRELEEKIKK